MRITEQKEGGATVLKVNGPVAGADAERLGKQIARAMEDAAGTVVLDVSQVPFLDSQALEVLVDAAERLIRTGRALTVCGARDVIREVFELTELAPLFEQHDDVAAALGTVQ